MKRFTHLVLIICVLSIWMTAGCRSAEMVHPDEIAFPPLEFQPPRPERVELSNGIIFYFMENHELPLINVTALVRTGSMYDPEGEEGLAEITGMVMRTGGTTAMTGYEIDMELDVMAADLSVGVEKDRVAVSLSALKESSELAMKIFSDILKNPVFEQKKMQEAQNIKVEELRRIIDNPQEMAFREFIRIMYGDNPRGRLSSVSSVEAITRNDMVMFHKRFFFPGNIMIAVTGDMTKEEAVTLMNRYFGSWDVSGEVPAIPMPDVHPTGSLYYIFKDISQSIIIIGRFAPGKDDPLYYAFKVLDFIVGSGGFRSRIFSTVRNELGLAYSAGSFYSAREGFGIFGTYAMTRTEATGKVLSVLQSITEDIKNRGVTGDELAWAKRSLINNFVFSYSSAEKIAFEYLLLEYYDLPRDFLESYRQRIEDVTENDLLRAAGTYLQDGEAPILVLGNEKKFDRPLSSFGTVKQIMMDDTAGSRNK
ncbi:MAG: insulinase family protein [Deltaproteobacteria bacterium]|nr:insulinase family protein [Deltaproteobacteria bacterium]MBN2687615.1 insulinase family protein [Deltaproteobacteria bacterium]